MSELKLIRKMDTITVNVTFIDQAFDIAVFIRILSLFQDYIQLMIWSQLTTSEPSEFLVTFYKGPRFRRTGKLDSKLYTKPTSTDMHLAYTSFHPECTFNSILEGQHRRSLIASSSVEQHTATMLEKFNGYSTRGYPTTKLMQVLLQGTTQTEKRFREERKRALTTASKKQRKVIALKLPYTNRTIQLANKISVTKLQRSIQNSCPVLHRASLGRLVIAHKSTMNLMERTRPKGLMAGYLHNHASR